MPLWKRTLTQYLPNVAKFLLIYACSVFIASAIVGVTVAYTPFHYSNAFSAGLWIVIWAAIGYFANKFAKSLIRVIAILGAALFSFGISESCISELHHKDARFRLETLLQRTPRSVAVPETSIKVMAEPYPDAWAQGRIQNNRILAVLNTDEATEIIDKWPAKEFMVYKVRFEDGRQGYIFSGDHFKEIEKPK